jgi:hypothetical protein
MPAIAWPILEMPYRTTKPESIRQQSPYSAQYLGFSRKQSKVFLEREYGVPEMKNGHIGLTINFRQYLQLIYYSCIEAAYG